MIFCYFATIEQLSFGIFWSELINNSLTQGVNIRKRLWSALRLTCGSISKQKWTYRETGHIEKLGCHDTAAVQLFDFERRSCGIPTKPSHLKKNSVNTTTILQSKNDVK